MADLILSRPTIPAMSEAAIGKVRELESIARGPIASASTSIDYVELRDADTLAPLGGDIGTRGLLAVACRFGATRLIDNVVLGEDAPPLP